MTFEPLALFTRTQMQQAFETWGCPKPLPEGKRVVYICPPGAAPYRITKTKQKGSDGRLLFLIAKCAD